MKILSLKKQLLSAALLLSIPAAMSAQEYLTTWQNARANLNNLNTQYQNGLGLWEKAKNWLSTNFGVDTNQTAAQIEAKKNEMLSRWQNATPAERAQAQEKINSLKDAFRQRLNNGSSNASSYLNQGSAARPAQATTPSQDLMERAKSWLNSLNQESTTPATSQVSTNPSELGLMDRAKNWLSEQGLDLSSSADQLKAKKDEYMDKLQNATPEQRAKWQDMINKVRALIGERLSQPASN